MLKTIFLGNSDFCIPTLQSLHKYTNILAIVTGLDKEITQRSKSIQKPLPKIYGEKHNIPVLQPSKIRDIEFLNTIKKLEPDMMVIISYGKILPPELFNIPALGTFNLHASLLPAYRGASPIQESLLNNDKETGITLQKINEKMDDGNIYWTKKHPISGGILYPQLREELAQVAALTLVEFLENYIQNKVLPQAKLQVGEPSFCGKIKKEDGLIDFKILSALEIFNRFQAFYTWPQIFFNYNNNIVKLEKISLGPDISDRNIAIKPGLVIQADKKELMVQTKQGTLLLEILKPANKKSQDYLSFINGYQIKKGDNLC